MFIPTLSALNAGQPKTAHLAESNSEIGICAPGVLSFAKEHGNFGWSVSWDFGSELPMLVVSCEAEICRADYRTVSLLWQCIRFPVSFKLRVPLWYHQLNFWTRDSD